MTMTETAREQITEGMARLDEMAAGRRHIRLLDRGATMLEEAINMPLGEFVPDENQRLKLLKGITRKFILPHIPKEVPAIGIDGKILFRRSNKGNDTARLTSGLVWHLPAIRSYIDTLTFAQRRRFPEA
jgi:hypothetical protein